MGGLAMATILLCDLGISEQLAGQLSRIRRREQITNQQIVLAALENYAAAEDDGVEPSSAFGDPEHLSETTLRRILNTPLAIHFEGR